jgi:hypothetical protein
MPTLPPAHDLIHQVREHGPGVLDRYAPEIDELADTSQIAAWLGIQPASIYRERARVREHGPAWPPPVPLPGRSPLWTWRAVVVYRAAMPGPGNRTTGAQRKQAGSVTVPSDTPRSER